MKEAMEKRKSDTAKILLMLRAGVWVPTHRLILVTHRFSARIYDLRRMGCVIVTQRTHLGAIYRLLKGPAQRRMFP